MLHEKYSGVFQYIEIVGISGVQTGWCSFCLLLFFLVYVLLTYLWRNSYVILEYYVVVLLFNHISVFYMGPIVWEHSHVALQDHVKISPYLCGLSFCIKLSKKKNSLQRTIT